MVVVMVLHLRPMLPDLGIVKIYDTLHGQRFLA
jgi:hypothetical protein